MACVLIRIGDEKTNMYTHTEGRACEDIGRIKVIIYKPRKEASEGINQVYTLISDF